MLLPFIFCLPCSCLLTIVKGRWIGAVSELGMMLLLSFHLSSAIYLLPYTFLTMEKGWWLLDLCLGCT